MSSKLHEFFLINVRDAMREQGMTQLELSQRLGVSRPYVNQVLSGKWVPGLELVERIANALGVSAAQLMEEAVPARR